MNYPHPGEQTRLDRLTEQDIVDRASAKRGPYFWMIVAALCFGGLLALYVPIHAWLHRHLELLAGILIGSLAQSIPWLIDRWRWLKWFSHQ